MTFQDQAGSETDSSHGMNGFRSGGMSRRKFLDAALTALVAGLAVQMVGCGGQDMGLTPSEDEVLGRVSDNHLHKALITKARLTEGGFISLDIRGTSDHPHTVELTPTEVESIRNGKAISKQSTSDWGHYHWVYFNKRESK